MKRYEYIQWDGMWDNEKEEYCSWYTIEEVMNMSNNYAKIWEKKYDELIVENGLLKEEIHQLESLLRKHNLEGYK